MDYGTGAVFGCPAHDQRDLDFARKYDLPVTRVVADGDVTDSVFIGDCWSLLSAWVLQGKGNSTSAYSSAGDGHDEFHWRDLGSIEHHEPVGKCRID